MQTACTHMQALLAILLDDWTYNYWETKPVHEIVQALSERILRLIHIARGLGDGIVEPEPLLTGLLHVPQVERFGREAIWRSVREWKSVDMGRHKQWQLVH